VAGRFDLKWQWLSTERFIEVLSAVVQVVQKETGAAVIVVGITPCSERVERQLKGSGEAIREANERMLRLCARMGPRVSYLDPGSFLTPDNYEAMVPDGIHFSSEGHRQLLLQLEDRLRHLI
jgi:lysophospholipase L1-like esterase